MGTSTSGHPPDRARLPARAIRRPARCRRTSRYAHDAEHLLAGGFRAGAISALHGPARRGLLGVLVEREGVRQRGAHDRRRRLRRRRGRRRGHAVPHDALRLQLARAAVARAVPAVRRASATASRSAKAPASRCSSGRGAAPAIALLLGVGESSDAHHMSTPHPEGLGAKLAMERALARRRARARRHRLHQPARHRLRAPTTRPRTRRCATLFGARRPCSSTKGSTGHLLGAAGITEAIISLLAIEHGLDAGQHAHAQRRSGAARATTCSRTARRACARVLSNSFGFGGSNCSLVLGAPR